MRNVITQSQASVTEQFTPELDTCCCNQSIYCLPNILEDGNEIIDIPSTEQNTTARMSSDPSPEEIAKLYRIVIPLLLAVCLLSFLFNLLIVCSAKWIRRRSFSPNLILSLSLAGADAFASLIVSLGLVLNSLLPMAFGIHLGSKSYCFVLALEAFRLGSLVSTALHLLALAANHHVGIAKPLHYGHIVTRRTTLLCAAATWVCPIAFFFVYFSSVPNEGFQSHECSHFNFLLYSPFRITTAILFFVPLAAMTFIYAHIFAIVRRHQPQNNSSSDKRLRRNIKAAVTTLLILTAYVLGWMPAVLYFVLSCLDCAAPFPSIPISVRLPVGVFANAMIAARCLADPVLYFIRMPEIRDALREMFGARATATNAGTPSSLQNTRTEARRLTLQSSQRKVNGYANGRNVISFERKEVFL